ncbi:Hpt domain-containing protein [Pseudooceanicola sp.]|uniref:Hpt domain-containing protein n=1 Tax=Pseudooceanicola sp. TaxID=1914328 RepID=UPI0035C7681D
MIDWGKVTELVADVGADGFDEVLTLFLQEVETALQTIALAEDLEAALHFVKGCALNLGFEDFARCCAEGEALAARGRPDEVDLETLHRIYWQSRALFLSEVRERIAA